MKQYYSDPVTYMYVALFSDPSTMDGVTIHLYSRCYVR